MKSYNMIGASYKTRFFFFFLILLTYMTEINVDSRQHEITPQNSSRKEGNIYAGFWEKNKNKIEYYNVY